ncbi:MAG: hypothetical protein ACYDH0_02685 [Candidatus Aminicenantales bacterium]
MKILKQLFKVLLFTVGTMGAFWTFYKFLLDVNFFKANIPDWIILSIVVFVVFAIGNIYYFLGHPREVKNDLKMEKDINSLRTDFDKLKKTIGPLEIELGEKIRKQGELIAQIYNSPYDHVKLNPTEEILYILRMLASEKEMALRERDLNSSFLSKYGKDKLAEYNILISKLANYGLIRMPDSGYDAPFCEITSTGLAYYDRTREISK